MPKITYHEFRPGKWVKLVDGKVIGPATLEEVTAWKRENAAPDHIWRDVVKQVKLAGRASSEPHASQKPEQAVLWEDIAKRAKPTVQAEGPPRVGPRQEDTEWTEQVRAWQRVPKLTEKPGSEPEQSPGEESDRASEPPEELGRTAAVATPATVTPKPAGRRTPAASASAIASAPAEASPKPDMKPRRGQTEPSKVRSMAAAQAPAGRKEVPVTTKPTAPEDEPADKPTEVVPSPKTASKPTTSRPTQSPKSAAEVTLSRETLAARGGRAKSPKAPAAEAAEQPPAVEERPPPKPRRVSSASLRRTMAKARPPVSLEQTNQLYLWIVAGQSDDLVAAVRAGLNRYQERFSHPAEVVLCHSDDLPVLERAKLPIDVREGKTLARRNFWIGLK